MQATIVVSVGSFILILALLALLRAHNSKFEVRPADIVVAVLPVVVFLLVTGKLQKFEIGAIVGCPGNLRKSVITELLVNKYSTCFKDLIPKSFPILSQ